MCGGNHIGDAGLGEKVRLVLSTVVAATVLLVVAGYADAHSLRVPHGPWNKMTTHQKVVVLRKQIHRDKSLLRFWHHHRILAMLSSRVAAQYHAETHWASVSLKIASHNLHKLLVRPTRTQAGSGGDLSAWMCIHRYEGAWNDPNPPYWGGLQMDMGFQETYGSEFLALYGTADHWPIIDQIIAARRARDGYGRYGARGYGPWPNTARKCGLR